MAPTSAFCVTKNKCLPISEPRFLLLANASSDVLKCPQADPALCPGEGWRVAGAPSAADTTTLSLECGRRVNEWVSLVSDSREWLLEGISLSLEPLGRSVPGWAGGCGDHVCAQRGAPSLGEAAPEATHRGVRQSPGTLQALEPLSPLPPMLPSREGAIGERHGGECTLKAEPRSICAIFFILILFTLFVVGVLAASLYRVLPLNRVLC